MQIFNEDGINGISAELTWRVTAAIAPFEKEICDLKYRIGGLHAQIEQMQAKAVSVEQRAYAMLREYLHPSVPWYMVAAPRTAISALEQQELVSYHRDNRFETENRILRQEVDATRRAICDLKAALEDAESRAKAAETVRDSAREGVTKCEVLLGTRKSQIAALKKVVDSLAGAGVSSLALDKPETFTTV